MARTLDTVAEHRAWPHATASRPGKPWPSWARTLVSIAIVYHLCAIVAGALAAPPSSDIEIKAATCFRRYYELISQGAAYRYYARLDTTTDPKDPRPWGTPVITADLEFEHAGEETTHEVVRLPRLAPIWPRLRFQRELDLAYHVSADPRWAASYARHLCKTRGCTRVAIYSQTHEIPPLERVREAASGAGEPVDLDAESTYTPRIKLGEFRCTEF
jgi:hypothetical protein